MIPFFDAHCDTITGARRQGESLRKNGMHVDLERLGAFSPCAQVFAIWDRPSFSASFSEPDAPGEVLYELFLEDIDFLMSELEKNGDMVRLCRSAEDIAACTAEGLIAALVSVEGAELLNCDEENLVKAYEGGVRIINPCWNFENILATSCFGVPERGLTEKGVSFFKKAQELGMIIDLSHSSEKTFWDMLEISKAPVIASHSNSKTVCPHPRNLTDEQFVALARQGGFAGINFCPDFLGEKADIGWIVRHIEHFLSLGGERAVAFGADLDGIGSLPEGIAGVEDVGKIYEALLKLNYSESLVRDIFYNNLMDMVARVL